MVELKTEKPNCYKCKHRGTVPGDAHSCCKHPIATAGDKTGFLNVAFLLQGRYSPAMIVMEITFDMHGYRNGWFMWPMNFDPVWLKTCNGFEEKEVEK